MDHAGSLSHTSNVVGCRGAREGEALGAELRESISGADSLCSVEPALVGSTHNFISLWDPIENFLKWKPLSPN